MIPRRIRLQNFLSYRECTVDFTGLHLAVLSGANGHGKSALLDAMTWALWGEARGARDADRIRGDGTAKEMLVDFEFESHGAVYRVIRRFVPGKGSRLDFHQILPDGTAVPLGGSRITDTEREIVRRLHLDYQTFVNSAFIAQGRSNEFTAKLPSERKEVLRNILGLEEYELLAQRAAELRKEVQGELQRVETRVEELSEATKQLDTVAEQLRALDAQRTQLANDLAAAERELAALREAEARRQELARRVEDLAEQCARLAEALEANRNAERQSLEDLQACEAVAAKRTEVEARYLELQRLRQEEQALAELQRAHLRLSERKRELEHQLDLERQGLIVLLQQKQQSLADCHAYIREAEKTAAELAELEARAQQRAERESAIADMRRRAEELRREAEGKLGEARTLRTQADELKSQEEQLRAAAGAPECPICHQPLTPEHVERVLQESAERRRAMGDRFRALLAEASQLTEEADEITKEADRAQQELEKEARADQQRLVLLETTRRAAEEASRAIPTLEEEIRATEERLAREEFGEAIRKELRHLDDELAALGYDAARHETLRSGIAALQDAEAAWFEVQRAAQQAAWLRDRLTQLAEDRRRLESEQQQTAARLSELQQTLATCEDVRPRLEEVEARRASLQAELNEANTAFGRLEERRRLLEAMAAEAAELRDRLTSLREQADLYAELAKAFGRDGVQAMLIDEAVPRIRETANTLLDRMTGGRIHVDIRTQRELVSKQGKQQETLEIRVSDELGNRAYEMYSGGEAFRVDFALRIALAKMLAERSGATLATLIVDEGFGTQDRDGIDRLVEALNAIAPEFRLILVVTHLDELKERFERRVEVQKDPERGSVARVV